MNCLFEELGFDKDICAHSFIMPRLNDRLQILFLFGLCHFTNEFNRSTQCEFKFVL